MEQVQAIRGPAADIQSVRRFFSDLPRKLRRREMAFRHCLRRAAGMEKDFPQSIRPGIPMSLRTSSVSDEADTLEQSHLQGLKGAEENSFSIPAAPRRQRAEGHLAPAKFDYVK